MALKTLMLLLRGCVMVAAASAGFLVTAAAEQPPTEIRRAVESRKAPTLSPEDLRPLLRMVLESAPKVRNEIVRDDLFRQAGHLALRGGDLEDARLICARIEADADKQELGGWIAGTMSAAGDAAGAKAFAQRLQIGRWDPHYLTGFALAQATAGKLAEARTAIAEVPGSIAKGQALLSLARISRDRKDLAAATSALQSRPTFHLDERDLAEVQALVGDDAAALQTAAGAGSIRPQVLCRIVKSMALRGDITGARQCVEKIGQNMLYEELGRTLIIEACALSGDKEATEKALEQAAADAAYPGDRSLLCYVLAWNGDDVTAKAVAEGLKARPLGSPMYLAYGMVVAGQLQRGDLAEARNTLEESREKAAVSKSDPQGRAEEVLLILHGALKGPHAIEAGVFSAIR